MKLEALEKRYKELREEFFKVQNQIKKIQLGNILPELKSKYEGKFWKYENSTSENDKWWLYSHCLEVTDKNGDKKLETKVFLPEPFYKKLPMTLIIMGAIILASAFLFREFYFWGNLYFACGMVSCLYGVGLYRYRKGVQKPSMKSE